MAIRDLTSERLFIDVPLAAGARLTLAEQQAHYLVNVLRLPAGAQVLVFNGRDGEWMAELGEIKKRSAVLAVQTQTRPQIAGPDIDYLFAPLKRSRLDYMVQKAVEMGVARLRPVLTHRTIAERVNLDRMRANAIEAAEQCGVLRVPEVLDPIALDKALATWGGEGTGGRGTGGDETSGAGRALVFCDEAASGQPPLDTLAALPHGPLAVLIGPEGGFDPVEREVLLSKPFVTAIWLGPRIMRADTAAVAALTLVNATRGDWR
jgi:16S rRNA (uracil1498-N3)-methyltransferase